MMTSIADHAAHIVQAFGIEPKPMDRLVAAYMRRHPELHSRERREIAETVFGIMRWRRRIEGMLASTGVTRPSVRDLAKAYRAGESDESWKEGQPQPDSFPGGVAGWHSFPEELAADMMRSFGRDAAIRVMDALNRPARPVIRANALKADRAEVMQSLEAEGIAVEPTLFSPYGMTLVKRADIRSTRTFKQGLCEVQDEGSQLAAMLTGASPGCTVLDACGGGGGKSLFLAMLMQNKGNIIAADPDERRLQHVRKRALRAGASCINAIATERLGRVERYRGSCDIVLVDAPCSGTGTIRRNPDVKWRYDRRCLPEYAARQTGLLQEYAAWLRPGGELVYVTCSILAEENEDVVQSFMSASGMVRVPRDALSNRMPAATHAYIDDEGYFRTRCEQGMDGFFACVLHLRGARTV